MILSFSNPPVKTKTGTVATVEVLKKQLNIPVDFTDDDELLQDLINVAVETVEDDTHSDILETENELTHTFNLDGSVTTVNQYIHIYQAPVKEVTEIEVSTDGTNYTTVDPEKYGINIEFNRVEITFLENISAAKIRFTFTTGYADEDRPLKLRHAVILKAADLFDAERSNYVIGAPLVNNNVYSRLIRSHVRTYWM